MGARSLYGENVAYFGMLDGVQHLTSVPTTSIVSRERSPRGDWWRIASDLLLWLLVLASVCSAVSRPSTSVKWFSGIWYEIRVIFCAVCNCMSLWSRGEKTVNMSRIVTGSLLNNDGLVVMSFINHGGSSGCLHGLVWCIRFHSRLLANARGPWNTLIKLCSKLTIFSLFQPTASFLRFRLPRVPFFEFFFLYCSSHTRLSDSLCVAELN